MLQRLLPSVYGMQTDASLPSTGRQRRAADSLLFDNIFRIRAENKYHPNQAGLLALPQHSLLPSQQIASGISKETAPRIQQRDCVGFSPNFPFHPHHACSTVIRPAAGNLILLSIIEDFPTFVN